MLQSSVGAIPVAVAGMGGLGKTELVVQYATQHLANYPGGVCWLNGRVGDFAGQIVQIAVLELGLEVPQEDRGKPTTLEEQVQWCWRHWVPTGQVLVVLDDVATWEAWASIVPRELRFRVVMTTREQDLARQFRAIALEVLELGKARDLLGRLEQSRRVEQDPAGAEVLCELVGRLPLGIELVGRYLANDRYLTLGEMAERLRQKGLSDPSMEKPLNAEMTAQRGAKAAFELTWERLDAPARRVARLLGYFALDEIPWALAEEMMQRVEGEEYSIRAVQTRLDNASLVQVELERLEVCWLHPLVRQFVQEKERATVKESGNLALQAAFVSRLLDIARQIPDNPPTSLIRQVERVKSHLQEVAEHGTDQLEGADLMWAFEGLARFYEGQGLYAQAEAWYEKCLKTTESRYQGDHPTAATGLNNLALLYHFQGRYSEAEPLYQQALEMNQRLFESDHPDMATGLNNLAGLYDSQGRYSEAEPLYQQALEMRQRLFEGDHPDMARGLNNLALLYDSQGRYSEAEPLYQQALKMAQRLFEGDHPDMARGLNNLALLYDSQGRYSEAEPLYQQALKMAQRLFEGDHPDVARGLNNLAASYRSQGRYSEAELLYQQALEMNQRLFEGDHPDVASSLNNLAALYYSQGRYSEAEPLYQQALKMAQRLFEGDHPTVARGLNNLALLYDSQGRYSEAEPLYQQALEMRQRLFEGDHPDVATGLNNLAVFYGYQGHFQEAEPLLLQALEMYQRVLGDQHPNTRSAFQSLQFLRQQIASLRQPEE